MAKDDYEESGDIGGLKPRRKKPESRIIFDRIISFEISSLLEIIEISILLISISVLTLSKLVRTVCKEICDIMNELFLCMRK